MGLSQKCTLKTSLPALVLLLIFQSALMAQGPLMPFRDTSLNIEQRIDDLMMRLSLAEKASLMVHNNPAIERLGIPAYNWWNEALHGVGRAGRATVFPQAIGLAATFEEGLIYDVASAISDEARAKHNAALKIGSRRQYTGLSFWSPNVNIFRDPRWGRGQETYGEDPFLTSRMGVAFVKGLQGTDPEILKAAACAKHFAVHSGPEKDRHHFNATPSQRDLHETYLPAFKALSDAGVEAVMCAYNRLEDKPCCGSNPLLADLLRDEWGFRGHIVTDCWALDDIWLRHKVTGTQVEAAAMAAQAGVNLNCGYIYSFLPQAVDSGLITEALVDEILRPTLRTRFRLGLFDPPGSGPFSDLSPEIIDGAEHRQLAYKAAAGSMVLLQNRNDVLPLDKMRMKKIFVTGPTAASIESLLGNYNGLSGNLVTFLEGITEAAWPGTVVDYKPGTPLIDTGLYYGHWEAGDADAVIACLGHNSLMEGEDGDAMFNPHGGDRSTLELNDNQLVYLRMLRENGPETPIIAVITGGGAIALGEVVKLADAVLFAWYPGAEGGKAAADIIFGDVNPSGRLPVTFYRSVDDLPPFDDYAMAGRTYKYFEGEPLYPFGFGLSYTSFDYLQADLSYDQRGDAVDALLSLRIMNNGDRKGAEVVQVYMAATLPRDEDPASCLVGFTKVCLEPGEEASIDIPLDLSFMQHWNDRTGKPERIKGTYEIRVGSSSRDIRVRIPTRFK